MKLQQKNQLQIKDLNVWLDKREILKGISLTLKSGEIHALMGPNGSGKSTLAYVLLGHPDYKVQNEKPLIKLNGIELNYLPTEERAKMGLFLAWQSPIAIPGVNSINLLRSAYQALSGEKPGEEKKNNVQNPLLARRWQASGLSLPQFTQKIRLVAQKLGIDSSILTRGIHDGFSGGEKKKMEMLQALVLQPKFAIFDEIDTGLDVDALRLVAKGIVTLAQGGTGVLIITHYQRILRYLKPNFVHVLVAGQIVESGRADLARKIEKEGYRAYAANLAR